MKDKNRPHKQGAITVFESGSKPAGARSRTTVTVRVIPPPESLRKHLSGKPLHRPKTLRRNRGGDA